MTTMTKATVLEWNADPQQLDDVTAPEDMDAEQGNAKIARIQATNDKFADAIDAGLTDGFVSRENEKFIRHWVDEAAAQAWIDFAVELNSPYGITLKSSQIVDL
jgi:hypothetical protein